MTARMAPGIGHRRLLGAALAAGAALLGACLLDLDGLTGGTLDGGAPDAASCAAAPVLDCSACPAPCAGASCAAVAAGEDSPDGIAAASDGLYWVSRGSGKVMRVAADGGAPEVLFSGAISPV